MDPLDQRLMDAGAAWRTAQPAPPDLDRIVARLDPRPSRGFSPRLAYLFAAGLLLLGAVAAAPGVGGFLQQFRGGLPITATPTASPTAEPSPAASAAPSAAPSSAPTFPVPAESAAEPTTPPSDTARSKALIADYESALVAGQWKTAFDMLAPKSPTHGIGEAAYAAERAPFFTTVAGRYVIGEPTQKVSDWTLYAPLIDGADIHRASLVEVDYPTMAGNNAGYEQFVVGPDTSGTWWIWPVR